MTACGRNRSTCDLKMKRLPMYLLWMQRREGSEKAWQIIRGLGERNPQQVAVAGKGAKRVFVSQGETCSEYLLPLLLLIRYDLKCQSQYIKTHNVACNATKILSFYANLVYGRSICTGAVEDCDG